MPITFRPTKTADEIAEMAAGGGDVSAYFTNEFTVVRPVREVKIDLTHGMLLQLDSMASRVNVSRQALIKTLLGKALSESGIPKRRLKKSAA